MRPIEIIIVVGVFLIVGLLTITLSSNDKEIEKCRKICGDKGFVYLPPDAAGPDALGQLQRNVKDCFCGVKR
jgi:hypothetical protein